MGFGARYFPIVLARKRPRSHQNRQTCLSKCEQTQKDEQQKELRSIFFLKAKKANKINIYWTTNTNHFILQPDLTSAFFLSPGTFRGAKYSKRSQILCETSADTNKKGLSVYSERFLGKNSPLKFAPSPAEVDWYTQPCDAFHPCILWHKRFFFLETMHFCPSFFGSPWSGAGLQPPDNWASNAGTDFLLGGRRLQWSWHALDLSELA